MRRARALTNRQILRAAILVVVGFATTGVLGIVRTAAIAASFGTGSNLDSFYAAQRIPELLFVLVAGGALGSAFIPVFSRYLAAEDLDGAWALASVVMTRLLALVTVLALAVAVFAEPIVKFILVPGQPADQQAVIVVLTRLMLISPIIFALSGLLMGILNAHQVFFLSAIAPSMYNVGIIFGAVLIARLIPVGGPPLLFDGVVGGAIPLLRPSANIFGLAFGTILGAALHLAVQIPGLRQVQAHLRFSLQGAVPGAGEVLLLMGPRILGQAVVQLNFFANTAFSSRMMPGSLSALTTAWQLLFLPLGIIAQSIGTAVFPTLSALAAEGDMVGFKNRLASALRGVLFLSFPAAVGLILLGEPLVRILFERGQWTPESTMATAWALQFFAVGMAGHSLLEVLSRAFYALSDTRTPVLVGTASLVVNVILSYVFIQFIGTPDSLVRGPFAGLALANSAATVLEGFILWWLLRRRIGNIHDTQIFNGMLRSMLAAAGMGGAVWVSMLVTQNWGAIPVLITGTTVGTSVFFGLSILLGLEEATTIPRMLLSRVRR